MSIKSSVELEALRRIGRIIPSALDGMASAVKAGITTSELDQIAGKYLASQGAEAAPRKFTDFPASPASASMKKLSTVFPATGSSNRTIL
jgi:methionyl aminopeptidase